MNRVGIARCTQYDEAIVERAVRQVVDGTLFPSCSGKRVLIKPNILSDSRPEAGITTHPLVVKAMIRICQERGASQVYVGDSPGLHTPAFHGASCGIAEVCRMTGATWVDFSRDAVQMTLEGGEKVTVAGILDEVDFTISLARFKTHQLMYTTGAVKNIFGIMPGLNKSPMHLRHPSRDDFALFMTRLFRKAKVAYALIDSVIGMEGPGPANGTLRYVGLMIGGADAFLVDRAQAIIMGHDPADIPILEAGRRAGLGTGEIDYPLLDAGDLVIDDFRRIEVEKSRGLFSSLVLPFLTRARDRRRAQQRPAPQFDHDRCVKCSRCVQICPAKALSLDRTVTIDTGRCIRCYCCAEMCPADAIRIEER